MVRGVFVFLTFGWVGLGTMAAAREISVDTDSRSITVVGGANFDGTLLPDPVELPDGSIQFIFAGDLVFQSDDVVRGVGSLPAVFLVGNDVVIPPGARFDFSAIGTVAGAGGAPGPGGGGGGAGGRGGAGGEGGKGGRLGTGGLIVSPNSPIPLSVTTPGTPPGNGGAGGSGARGIAGGRGSEGRDGQPGFGNPEAAKGRRGAKTTTAPSRLAPTPGGTPGQAADWIPPVFWGSEFLRELAHPGMGEETAFKAAFYDGQDAATSPDAADHPAPSEIAQPNAVGNPGQGGLNLGGDWSLAGGASGGGGSGGAGGPGGNGGGGGGGGGGGNGEWAEPLPTDGLDLDFLGDTTAAAADAGVAYFVEKLVDALLKKRGISATLNIFKVPTYDIGASGGRGGDGGRGAAGGPGAFGGQGGAGGAGGGALMIHALGTITFDGEADVSGADGEAGSAGGVADDSLRPNYPGRFGDDPIHGFGMSTVLSPFGLVASLSDDPPAGTGGDGANGGHSGVGSDGFPGGQGGGGAGGTIIFSGTSFAGSGSLVLTGGNAEATDPLLKGGDGRFFLGTNEVPAGTPAATVLAAAGVTAEGVVASVTRSGAMAPNPFLAGAPETPTLSGLPEGAESFGLTGFDALGTDASDTFLDCPDAPGTPCNLAGVVPMASVIGAIRLDVGPAPLDDDYAGYDLVLVFNPRTSELTDVSVGLSAQALDGSGTPIPDPELDAILGANNTDLAPFHSELLTLGGYTRDPLFGNAGDVQTGTLAAGEVFAFLVPEDTPDRGLNIAISATSGGEAFRLEADLIVNDQVVAQDFNPDIDVYDSVWVGPAVGGPDGDWSDPNNWETSLDGGAPAAIVPSNTVAQAYNVDIELGSAEVQQDLKITIDRLHIGVDNGLIVQDGQDLIIEKFSVRPTAGVIDNEGFIRLDASTQATTLRFSGNGLVLTGGGVLETTDSSLNLIGGIRSSDSLIQEAGHSIFATGSLGAGNLGISNFGAIRPRSGTNAMDILTLTVDPTGSASRASPGFVHHPAPPAEPASQLGPGDFSNLRLFDGYFDLMAPVEFDPAPVAAFLTLEDARVDGHGQTLLFDNRDMNLLLKGSTRLENFDTEMVSTTGTIAALGAALEFDNAAINVPDALGDPPRALTLPDGSMVSLPAAMTFRDTTLDGALFNFQDPGGLPTCGSLGLPGDYGMADFTFTIDGADSGLSNTIVSGNYCFDRLTDLTRAYVLAASLPASQLGLAQLLDPLDHITARIAADRTTLSGSIECNGLIETQPLLSGLPAVFPVDGAASLGGSGAWRTAGLPYRFEGSDPGSPGTLWVGPSLALHEATVDVSALFLDNQGELSLTNLDYDATPLGASATAEDFAAFRRNPVARNAAVLEPRSLLGGGSLDNEVGILAFGESSDPVLENLRIVGGTIRGDHYKSNWSRVDLATLQQTGGIIHHFNTELDGVMIESPSFDSTFTIDDMLLTPAANYAGVVTFDAASLDKQGLMYPAGPLFLNNVHLATHTDITRSELGGELTLDPDVTAVFEHADLEPGFRFNLPGATPGQPFSGKVYLYGDIGGTSTDPLDPSVLTVEPELDISLMGNIGQDELSIINRGTIKTAPRGSAYEFFTHSFDPVGTAEDPPGFINRGVLELSTPFQAHRFSEGHYDNEDGEIVFGSGSRLAVYDSLIEGGTIRGNPSTSGFVSLTNSRMVGVRFEDVGLGGSGSVLDDSFLENCTVVSSPGSPVISPADDLHVIGDLTLEGSSTTPGVFDFSIRTLPVMADPSEDRIVIGTGTSVEIEESFITFNSLSNAGLVVAEQVYMTTPLVDSDQTLSIDVQVPDPQAPLGELVTLAELGVSEEELVKKSTRIENSGEIQSLTFFLEEAVIDNKGGTLAASDSIYMGDTLIQNLDGRIATPRANLYNAVIYGGEIEIADMIIGGSGIALGQDYGIESITTLQDVTLSNSTLSNAAFLFLSGIIDGTNSSIANLGETSIMGIASRLTIDSYRGSENSRLSINGATIEAISEFEVWQNGIMFGFGTIENSMPAVIGGAISPGFSAGTLEFTGDLELEDSAEVVIEIGGQDAEDNDLITELGTSPLTLAGSLHLRLVGGFVPAPTDTFTIITSNQPVEGSFGARGNGDRVTIPGAGSFQLNYGPSSSFDPNAVVLSDFSAVEPGNVYFVDVDQAGPEDGLGWGSAFRTLDAAITPAQPGDEIWMAEGDYFPPETAPFLYLPYHSFFLKHGISIYGGFSGVETTREQRDTDLYPVTIKPESQQTANSPLFQSSGAAGSVTLDGLNIVEGKTANESPFEDGYGAGLFVSNGNHARVRDCVFERLDAPRGGKAIAAFDASVSVEDCEFRDDLGSGPNDAVIHLVGSEASFTNALFEDHIGNAFYLEASRLEASRVIVRNHADTNEGCGARILAGSEAAFTDCSFLGNIAGFDGGVIWQAGGATSSFVRCAFIGNQSGTVFRPGGRLGQAGVIRNEGEVLLEDCLFAGNEAPERGGAIYQTGDGATLTATRCTFVGNQALQVGGGAIFGGNVTLSETLIWNNAAVGSTTSPDASLASVASQTVEHSLIGNWNPAGSGNLDGTNTSNDPLFREVVSPLSAPTLGGNYRLRLNSPAIDAGTASVPPGALDLDGSPRLVGAAVDLGSFERQPAIFVDQSAGGAETGYNWGDAFTSLQDALAVAETGDEIWVARGTYTPGPDRDDSFVLPRDLAIYGGFRTDRPVVVRNPDPASNGTVLSGDIGNPNDPSDNSYNVVNALAANTQTRLDGFTITGGNANGSLPPQDRGGGITLLDRSPALANLIFRENRARYGGALHAGGSVVPASLRMWLELEEDPASNGTVMFDSSGNGNHGVLFNNNGTTNKSVAGINGKGLYFDGTVDRLDATAFDIDNNFTLSLWVNPTTTASGQAFIGKHSSTGANQVLLGFYNGGYHFRIHGAFYEEGTPTTGWQHLAVVGIDLGGGLTGVTVYRNGSVLWTHTFAAVVGNVAGGLGWTLGQDWDSATAATDHLTGSMDSVSVWNGALSESKVLDLYLDGPDEILDGDAAAQLSGVAFLGNVTDIAGGSGGACYLTNNARPGFTNVVFAGNHASTIGSALRAFNSDPTFTNCTVTANASASGAAFYLDGGSAPEVLNSIFWNNTGGAFSGGGSPGADSSDNLVEGLAIGGHVVANSDPYFARNPDPGDGSWPTAADNDYGDLRLTVGSPALDLGDPGALPAGVTTDLAGRDRVQGAGLDLGAYEGAWVTFARLHPSLAPDGDANGNGHSNLYDYLAGGDPTAPDDPTLRPRISGNQLTFSLRNDAADLLVEFQKSSTLLDGSWEPMIEGVDYAANPMEITNGPQTFVLFDLITTEPTLFCRGLFSSP